MQTGVRVSEACGLKWRDIKEDGIHIDCTNQTIKDWQKKQYVNVETAPKTAAGKRIIPITASLHALLDIQKKHQKEECLKTGRSFDSVNGYIFANTIGNPADRNNIARTLRAVCKQAGIEERGIHSLRHTFATNWTQNSSDIASLSEIMGHADKAFTYKTYCHADSTSKANGMNMIESILQRAAQ